jgi:hypothetical protein
MALPRVVQLIEFQSGELFERESRAAGTYIQVAEIKGNSILSSVFINTIAAGATLKINYYDTTTSPELGQRFNLAGHDLITDSTPALSTLRTLVTRIHHKIVAEAIVTGGAIDFSLYATVVSSTASDLDSALNLDGAVWEPAVDKGLAVMCLDRITGELDFIPCENGALKVTGTVTTIAGGVTTPKNTTAITSATPGTETSVALVAVKRFRITNRGNAILKYSFLPTESGSNYASLYPNGTAEEDGILSVNVTIYMQSPNPSQRVELVSWT